MARDPGESFPQTPALILVSSPFVSFLESSDIPLSRCFSSAYQSGILNSHPVLPLEVIPFQSPVHGPDSRRVSLGKYKTCKEMGTKTQSGTIHSSSYDQVPDPTSVRNLGRANQHWYRGFLPRGDTSG